MLNPIDIARNNLIDEILSIDNIKMLENLKTLISKNKKNNQVEISEQQFQALQMSDLDIKANRLTDNEMAYTKDLEWLNQQ